MHQPIKDGLEDYLSGREGPRSSALHAHLAICPDCRREAAAMQSQSLLLRTLRAPEAPEPAAGFYARVLDRIEAQTRPSFWADFLEPVFARRLMYSSAILLLLVGTYMLSTPVERYQPPEVAVLASDEEPVVMGVDQERDRDAMLVTLTTYSE